MRLVDRGRRVVQGALADNITGEAAKAAYYFFLSLFPLILVGFSSATLVGGEQFFDRVLQWLTATMPPEAAAWIGDWLGEVTGQEAFGPLSIGALLAVWAASNFFAALGDALDTMFDVRGRGRWWKKRLKALLLMVIGGAVLICGAVALVAGPQLAAAAGLGGMAHLVAWPVVFVALVGLLWLVYYVMPAHDQGRYRRELLVGAVAGAVIWLVAAAGFRFYVTNIASFGRVYGLIGGIIVLLLWLYMSAIAILLGGKIANVLAEERRDGPRPRTGSGHSGGRADEARRRAA